MASTYTLASVPSSEVRLQVWNGKVALQISADDIDPIISAKRRRRPPTHSIRPFFIFANRCSYLPLLIPQIRKYFVFHISKSANKLGASRTGNSVSDQINTLTVNDGGKLDSGSDNDGEPLFGHNVSPASSKDSIKVTSAALQLKSDSRRRKKSSANITTSFGDDSDNADGNAGEDDPDDDDDLINNDMSTSCEVWFSFNGQPLPWHYPIGLLYDLSVNSKDNLSEVFPVLTSSACPPADLPLVTPSDPSTVVIPSAPWPITIHFCRYPKDKLIPLLDHQQQIASVYFSALKEAECMRNGSCKNIMNLPKTEQSQLWDGIWTHQFDKFWKINTRLLAASNESKTNSMAVMGSSPGNANASAAAGHSASSSISSGTFSSLKSLPIRMYWADGTVIQYPIDVYHTDSGIQKFYTVGDLLGIGTRLRLAFGQKKCSLVAKCPIVPGVGEREAASSSNVTMSPRAVTAAIEIPSSSNAVPSVTVTSPSILISSPSVTHATSAATAPTAAASSSVTLPLTEGSGSEFETDNEDGDHHLPLSENYFSTIAITHGVILPNDTPLLWLAQNFAYPDNFVHLFIKMMHKI